jgi:hypothetical protein
MANYRDKNVQQALNMSVAKAGYLLHPRQEQAITSSVKGSDIFVIHEGGKITATETKFTRVQVCK